MQYLNEPTFNQLRTIEQLGYVVSSGRTNKIGLSGCRFVVQSPKESCEYIVNSINKFLDSVNQKIAEEFTKEDFDI